MKTEEKKLQVRNVRFASFGSCVPPRILTNADLEKIVDTSDEWIVTRTGIKERHVVDPEMAASDLAYPAGLLAMERAGVSPEEIDAIVVATVTGDHWFPSTACVLQARFGATRAYCMDVMAGCSGFLYATNVGHAFVASGQANTVLVIGVEILTKITNWEDRATCILFGDAAGATILRAAEGEQRIIGLRLGADGTNASMIQMPGGGTRMPWSQEVKDKHLATVQMRGNEVFKIGVRTMEDVARQLLEQTGYTPEDVDVLITHQANMRIIEATAKRLGVPPEKVFCNIHKYGNTSSASVPLAVDEAIRDGKIKHGDLVMTVVFGAGLTWGACLFRW